MNSVTVSGIGELPYAMEEAVNRLRVNVGFFGENIRKIMITSAFPNEGKSTVSLNLWRQMAEAGVSCVLVDMDLRASVLADTYSFKGEEGVKYYGTSDYLSGMCTLEESIVHTQFPKGDILLNRENTINPSMLITGKKFSTMVDQLAEKYRYVFLDTPPVGIVSDGESIASNCDGAMLVIRSGDTSTRAVRQSIGQIERSGCPILGYVLNRAAVPHKGYYSKHYGYGYGYGYGYYSKKSSSSEKA